MMVAAAAVEEGWVAAREVEARAGEVGVAEEREGEARALRKPTNRVSEH